ncbi:facilitated trehalose transporter Tret1-like [Pieris rapae]|uniref:facilitated trehalose transporter Tret1-like n=1 Tax=Pieris rapae TaxID=64459 RepID=UPI001E27BFC1|nr:facilitated trehalose transporter Tret1-like [Pieris rapae]
MVVSSEYNLQDTGHTRWQWTYSCIVSLGFIIYGMETGWLSPLIEELQSENSPLGTPVSDMIVSWWATIIPFCGAFLVPICTYLADNFGRKLSIIVIILPEIVSIILRLARPTIVSVTFSRVLCSFTAAGFFSIIPVYIREISEEHITGSLGSLTMLSQNIGFFVIYLIGALFDYFYILCFFLPITIAMLLLMIKAPESPAYLVKKMKISQAYKTVAFLRGLKVNDERVGKAVQYMQQQEDEFKSLPKIGITSILNDKLLRRGFILLVMLFTTQALSGAFAIITYASVILASMETKLSINPELETVSLPIVMIIASLLLTFIAEKFGRRTLQASGYLISALTFTILATFILLQDYGYATPRWLPIGCMVTIVAMYAATIRPLPFIVATELLHFRVRAKLMGMLAMFLGLMNSVHLISYIPMKTYLGLPATLMIFGICNVFGILFSLLLPETKGRTVEEIRTQIERRMK